MNRKQRRTALAQGHAAANHNTVADALAHHKAGRLGKARQIYEAVLAIEPDNPDALHLLGVALHQTGGHREAIELIRRALSIRADQPEALSNLGAALLAIGDVTSAAEVFESAIALKPDYAEAYQNLGVALTSLGRCEDAIAAHHRAIDARPDFAEAHASLAARLRERGHFEEAAASFRRAVELRPDRADWRYDLGLLLQVLGPPSEAADAFQGVIALRCDHADAHAALAATLKDLKQFDAAVASLERAIALRPNVAAWHSNLGAALLELGRPAEAAAACRRAIALRVDQAEAHATLATALKDLKDLEAAAAALRQAIALKPDVMDWRCNLGAALTELGRLEEALTVYRVAATIGPDCAQVHHGLGLALVGLGRLPEAVTSYRRAIALRPDYADAHGALSLSLLKLGDLEQGFEEYRWRWKSSNFPDEMPQLPCPLWEGEDLKGKAVLVHCEQGFGDSIQFVRYAGLLVRQARRVTVLTDALLIELFRSIPGLEVETTYDPQLYDFHIPLICLPRVFRTTLATVPRQVPYLTADATKASRWAQRLAGFGRAARIGVVWAGDAANAADSRRSMRLAQFAPLVRSAGLVFISLQKGEPSGQARRPPPGMRLVDWTDELHDFGDTAALVENLDLVITVDTSVAHLAGALGKPVWVLSRFDGCWRWLNGREDSPWYPTMRLFHQKSPGEWNEVLERVTDELSEFLGLSSDRANRGAIPD